MTNNSWQFYVFGKSTTIILILTTSFFLSNILTPKKDDGKSILKTALTLFFFYAISHINSFFFSWKSIFILIGHIIAIFAFYKDKPLKKFFVLFMVFGTTLIANGIGNKLLQLKLGISEEEFLALINTTEGYNYIYNTRIVDYSDFALQAYINITVSYIFISLLLFYNRKKYNILEIFLIVSTISFLGITLSILIYFKTHGLISLVLYLLTLLISIGTSFYVFNKIKFYQLYYKQKLELNFLKNKETMAYDYYENLLKKEEEIKMINHDIRNDLQVIIGLKDKNKQEELINKIVSQLDTNSLKKYSNNEMINIILNNKVNLATQKNVKLNIKITNNLDFMESIDICNLLSNILDNALENSTKEITFIINKKMSNYIIKCTNDINNKVDYKTSKKGFNHGYGMKIINNIVDKYHGEITINQDKNNFYLNIIINSED